MTTHTETTTSAMLTGSFRDRAAVERANDSLLARGYANDEINVIMSDDTRKQHFSTTTEQTELGNKAAEGGLIGTGIPEERAKTYETDIKAGGIVVGVTPRSAEDAQHIESEWAGFRAEHVQL